MRRRFGCPTLYLEAWNKLGLLKEPNIISYKALMRSLITYAALPWTPNTADSNVPEQQIILL